MKTIAPGLLEHAVERLKAEFQPEEIYLFGSHAWGNPHENSDVDLFVVVRDSEARSEVSGELKTRIGRARRVHPSPSL